LPSEAKILKAKDIGIDDDNDDNDYRTAEIIN